MDLKLLSGNGDKTATVSGSDALFGREYNEALIHQLVIAYQANGRQGTRAQKGRADINKSHKKPWAQKGTGRARAGQANSPLWRGGGKIFPSMADENFEQKVNRKMYRGAIAALLSELARLERLTVVESFALEAPKTRLLAARLRELGLGDVLIVVEAYDEKLELASRNLLGVTVLPVSAVDPVSLVRHERVLATVGAVRMLEEKLS